MQLVKVVQDNAFARRAGPGPRPEPGRPDAELRAGIKKKYGIDLDQLLDLANGELLISILVDDSSKFPAAVITLESKAPAILQGMLKVGVDRMLAGMFAGNGGGGAGQPKPLEWKTEKLGQGEMLYLAGPMLEKFKEYFQPCVTATKTHLIIATRRDALRKVIDLAGKDRGSLAHENTFRALRKEMPGDAGILTYINTRGVAKWFGRQLKAHPGDFGINEATLFAVNRLIASEKLWADLKPNMTTLTATKQGFHYKGIGSTPSLTFNPFGSMMTMPFIVLASKPSMPMPVVREVAPPRAVREVGP